MNELWMCWLNSPYVVDSLTTNVQEWMETFSKFFEIYFQKYSFGQTSEAPPAYAHHRLKLTDYGNMKHETWNILCVILCWTISFGKSASGKLTNGGTFETMMQKITKDGISRNIKSAEQMVTDSESVYAGYWMLVFRSKNMFSD